MTYTLGQAALAVGKSKGALSKAIKTGRISATKLDNGSYSIDPSELHRVYAPLPSPTEVNSKPTPQNERLETPRLTAEKLNDIQLLQAKLDLANERIDELKNSRDERIEELKNDRDAWKQQANSLLAAPDKRGLLQRIFGKG
jgi:hypothetical protein